MFKELYEVVNYEEILEFKRFKTNEFRSSGKIHKFTDWLKTQGYEDKVYLPLYKDEDGSYNTCLNDYFLILNTLSEVSVVDTLQSGYEVIRNDIHIFSESLVGGASKRLCLYCKEFERILDANRVKYLILNLEQFTGTNL